MGASAGFNCTVQLASLPSTAFTNEATTADAARITYTMTNILKRALDKNVATVVQFSTDSGVTWNTATGYTLFRCNARVVFASAQSVGTQVRFASGSYMPLATLGNGVSTEFAGKIAMLDGTVYNTPGVYTFVPGLLTATLKVTSWWVNTARAANLQNRDLLMISFTLPSGNRYEAFCYVSDCSFKSDVKALISDDPSFQLTDELAAA